MAQEGTGSCSGRSGSDLSNESDLDDIPLFHPSLMPAAERHAPLRLAMPHAGPMLTLTSTASGGSDQKGIAKTENQANTPRARRDPAKLSLNLGHLAPAHAAPQQNTQFGLALPSATSIQRPDTIMERGSTSLATPDPAIEPLPTSRTSGVRSPVTTLQLPMHSNKQAPQSKIPALPLNTSSTEVLQAPNHVLVSARQQPSSPQLCATAGTHLPADRQNERLASMHRSQEHSSTGSIHNTHSSPCLTPSGHAAYSSPEDDSLLIGTNDITADQHSPHSSDVVIEACLLSQPFCRVVIKAAKHSNQAAQDKQCISVVSDAVRQQVLQQCGEVLDIKLHDLELYQVSPIPSTQQGTQKLAVNISTNSFSLAALEQLLARNKHLEAVQLQNAGVIASMQKDHEQQRRELQHTHEQLLVRATQQECALKAYDCKQKQLEQEVELLREKLREADDHRRQLKDVIDQLSKEMKSTLRLHGQHQQQPLQQ